MKKRRRVPKKKDQPSLRTPESQFSDYRRRICDKCYGYIWTDQNRHHCGGNLS